MKNWIDFDINFKWGAVLDCLPSWSWEELVLEDMDIWCVLSGRGTLNYAGGSVDVAEGDCLVMRAGCQYSATHDKQNPLSIVVAHFEFLRDGNSVKPAESHLPPLRRRVKHLAFLGTLIKRAVAAHQAGRQDHANAWLRAALIEVADQDDLNKMPDLTDPVAGKIEAICQRIVADPGGKHLVQALAQDLDVTGSRLVRLFRKHKGVTPREFITRVRIQAAKELLLASNLDVGQIADRLGYDNFHFFSRQFKEKVGVPPTAYRRNARSNAVQM